MYCKKCGNEIKDSANFCRNCGTKIDVAEYRPLIRVNFYSEDWTRRRVFAIASMPYYDVMADENFIYFIKLPKYDSSLVGLIVGLLLFNIIGAFIGASIGSSSDAKKRGLYRAAWIDSGNKIISNDFAKDIQIKIPINEAREPFYQYV